MLPRAPCMWASAPGHLPSRGNPRKLNVSLTFQAVMKGYLLEGEDKHIYCLAFLWNLLIFSLIPAFLFVFLPWHRGCSGWACLLREKGQTDLALSACVHTSSLRAGGTRGVLRGTRPCWAVANAILHSGHVALWADSSGRSSAFISCACLVKVLSGLRPYKCPFCISPAPAGQPTIGCTFISAKTSQREHTFFCRRKSAPPHTLPLQAPQK